MAKVVQQLVTEPLREPPGQVGASLRPGSGVLVGWTERLTTPARVVYATSSVVLLEGDLPGAVAAHVGRPLRVFARETGPGVQARLVATGRAGRYLVALGTRPIRSAQRQRVDLPVSVHCADPAFRGEGRIVDLSRSGARLVGVSLPTGSVVSLQFGIAGRVEPVHLAAVVVRDIADATGAGLGVAFRLSALPPSLLRAASLAG